jgi:transcriptional regulator with XRE-family HTH domain
VERAEAAQVGARIAQARRERGLTQSRLAEELAVTTRSVQNYEAGVVVPWKHLGRIEVITRKRSGWLLRGDEDGGGLDTRLRALENAMEQHHALLREHLEALRQNTTRIREQREALRRRLPPGSG